MSDKQAANRARRAFNIEVGDLVLLSTRYLSLRFFPGNLKPHFGRLPNIQCFFSFANSKVNVSRQDPSLSIRKLNKRWRKLLDTEGMANIANT